MGRKVLVLGLGVLALGVPAVARAARPEHISIPISISETDEYFTETCGTEVVFSVTGTLRVTLWRNAEGLVVRELDTLPGVKVTYSAPETGNSFSFPASGGTFYYPGGAQVGSEATFRGRGVFGRVTGFIPPDAGTFTLVGEVTGFDEHGIPLVDFPDPPIRETGNRVPGEEIDAAFCEALTGA